MTQRRRRRRARRGRFGRRAFLAGAAAPRWPGQRCCWAGDRRPRRRRCRRRTKQSQRPPCPRGEWRAVWVSYLGMGRDGLFLRRAFRAGAAALMDNCLSIGLNTVIAQVRPFGDALYRSTLFPWSHLCTGVQGQDPGFDPLDVLITEAHRPGPFAGSVGEPLPPPLLGEDAARTGGK